MMHAQTVSQRAERAPITQEAQRAAAHALPAHHKPLLPASARPEPSQSHAAHPPAPLLLSGYSATVDALLGAVESSLRGDHLLLRSYVVEEGMSSRRVVVALRDAARRGVRVRLGVDRSPLSSFTRAWERTTTLAGALVSLAADLPRTVTLEPGTQPDHSKLLLLRRRDAEDESVAILGGVNLGGALETVMHHIA